MTKKIEDANELADLFVKGTAAGPANESLAACILRMCDVYLKTPKWADQPIGVVVRFSDGDQDERRAIKIRCEGDKWVFDTGATFSSRDLDSHPDFSIIEVELEPLGAEQ